MSKEKIKKIHKKMDHIWKMHKVTRFLFPAIDDKCEGVPENFIKGNSYKKDQRFFNYSPKGLTKEDIHDIRKTGHYLNQNFIIRLSSTLESEGIAKKTKNINDSFKGAEHVKVLIDLRNIFAHELGKFDKSNDEHVRIYRDIIKLYRLTHDLNDPNEFRLRIDRVLDPMLIGCKSMLKNS